MPLATRWLRMKVCRDEHVTRREDTWNGSAQVIAVQVSHALLTYHDISPH